MKMIDGKGRTLGEEERFLTKRAFWLMMLLLIMWIGVAYLFLPKWWQHRERWQPELTQAPRLTTTSVGIPGDPVNLAIIGSKQSLISAMTAAGWKTADPITLGSSLHITESAVLHRPYDDAPVSNLYLFGRKEDLAFEKTLDGSAKQRHHVRFWHELARGENGEEAWWGAVTFDQSVGFSHTTGQITHHISPEIDTERDDLGTDLDRSQKVEAQHLENNFQKSEGRNGGGDPWRSDGALRVIHLRE